MERSEQSTVEECMTTPVLTANPSTPVDEIADAMLVKGIKSIVCLEAGCEPAGILTSTDFIAMVSDQGVETAGTVREYMTTDVVTVEPDLSMRKAAGQMVEHDVAHLPVFDGENVLGIVTSTDVTGFVATAHD